MVRLNQVQVQQLSKLLQENTYKDKELSEKFNCSIKTIQNYKQKQKQNSLNSIESSIQTSSYEEQSSCLQQQSSIYSSQSSCLQQQSSCLQQQSSCLQQQSSCLQQQSSIQNSSQQQSVDSFNRTFMQNQGSTQQKMMEVQSMQDITNNSRIGTHENKQNLQSLINQDNSLENLLNNIEDNKQDQQDQQDQYIQDQEDVIEEQSQVLQSNMLPQVKVTQQKQITNFIKHEDSEQQNQREKDLVTIRQYIQCFKQEEVIKFIIGNNEKQIQSFIGSLHQKSDQELQNIRNTINFELRLNKISAYSIDSLKTVLIYIEKILSFVGIDIMGSTEELFSDDEFTYHLQLELCELNYLPSSRQILLFKFLKSFYMQYNKNKNTKVLQEKMKKVNDQMDADKYKDLFQ